MAQSEFMSAYLTDYMSLDVMRVTVDSLVIDLID